MAFESLPSTGPGSATVGFVARAAWGEQVRLNFEDHEDRLQDVEAAVASVWRGAWDPDTAYNGGDLVSHDGSTWRASGAIPVASPADEPGVTSPSEWELFAAAAGAGTLDLDDLGDVAIGSPLSDNDVLTYDSGSQTWVNAPAAGAGIISTTLVRKSGDESVTSSDVLQNDNELVVALAASATYEVRYAFVYQAGTTGDLKWQWQAPSDVVGIESALRISNSAASSEGNVRASSGAFTSGAGGVLSAGGTGGNASILGSMMLVTTTGGNLQLTWAQETSNGTATILRTGCWLIATRLL